MFAGFAGALLSAVRAGAEAPPRYGLSVGDWLIYERQVAVRARDESVTRSRDQLQIWCFAVENDERLLLVDRIANLDGPTAPMAGVVLHIDSAGRRRLPPETTSRLGDVEPALDLLPPLRSALQSGPTWRSPPDVYGRCWHCQPSQTPPSKPGELVFDFSIEDATGATAATGQIIRGRFRFDTAAGVVTKLEVKHADERRGTQSESITTLRHRVRNEDRWCVQRVAETQRFLRAQAQEDAAIRSVFEAPAAAEAHLARLDRLWEALVVDTDSRAKSPLHILSQARRVRLPDEIARLRAAVAMAQRWQRRPPPPWTLQDADGRTVSSEAFAGRVLVECFWSTESIAAVRALETLRRLRADLQTDQLEIVCINLDDDYVIATGAIRSCGDGLAHVLGAGLREAEGLAELPVFRVRDAEGNVRTTAIGWRASITELVRPLIR